MLSVVVFLEAHREQVAAMRTAVMLHASNCLEKEPGCRHYDVGLDTCDPASFVLYQVYENEAAYRAHKEYPHYAEFRLKVEPWIASRRVLTFELLSGTGLA
jgi:(4S)-4-hydroxy-5-phosphonooxypentane-2,3-dione isomerase